VLVPLPTPLQDLIKTFFEMGGKLMACVPCLKARGITEDELIEGTKLIAAATVVAETSSADATLTY
jgi:predicted peroxiredoxin